jgi:alpha-beta hydrolase superfamily lysophospholipase
VFGKFLARREIHKGRGMEPSSMLDKLCFGAFGKSVKQADTPCDWLSRDKERVAQYMGDPLCGFPFTPWGYLALFCATGRIASIAWAKKVPDKPILLLSGDRDPVGQMGKGVKKVYKHLSQTGHNHVEMRLYPEGRHEMHNELNRKEVFEDYLLFLESVEAGGEFEA